MTRAWLGILPLCAIACGGPEATGTRPPTVVAAPTPAVTPVASDAPPSRDDQACALARETLLARGLDATWLDGSRARCRVRWLDGRGEVHIEPGPVDGAPDHLEVGVSEDLTEVGRVFIDGSTWGVGSGITIRGVEDHARHAHGGAAADVGHASFVVDATRPIRLRVVDAFWLVSSTCEPAFESRARLASVQLFVEGASESVAGDRGVELTAGTHPITIGFVPQSAYTTHCDRFAVRVRFDVGGATVTAIAETRVTRFEPYREDR